jgi:fructose-specific phosphotransferase system IIC component
VYRVPDLVLPGFIAGYLVAFLVKLIEKKVQGGLEVR